MCWCVVVVIYCVMLHDVCVYVFCLCVCVLMCLCVLFVMLRVMLSGVFLCFCCGMCVRSSV